MVSTRELDSRMNDGIQVRLLWCEHDGRLWVEVLDTKTGDSFHVEARDGERPVDVFHHPYAYAAHHHIDTGRRIPATRTCGLTRVLIAAAGQATTDKDGGDPQVRREDARRAASDQSSRSATS